ncbi:Sulfotransferase family protein [Nocardioides psychrotolerans]|uniref:Sulfotransferase family protein n=2 Tax=Nocardioides psychrotolerans TaxID=1005945 RepID=A0A1I3BVV1_9ACTN|nr:Sulfotransferase family protein [Nocardioides psychrotolerans]
MDAQFDRASHVGDKLTVARLQVLWEQHPTARFVCIVRDVAEVAASWDRRATTVTDRGWPESLDARKAVEFWNQHNARIRRAARIRPEQVAVVEHSSFFGDPDAHALRRVLAGLDLAVTPEVETAFAAAHARYADVSAQERLLSAEAQLFLERHADLRLWRSLRRLAG